MVLEAETKQVGLWWLIVFKKGEEEGRKKSSKRSAKILVLKGREGKKRKRTEQKAYSPSTVCMYVLLEINKHVRKTVK